MEQPHEIKGLSKEAQGQVTDRQVDDENISWGSHLRPLQDDEADQAVPEDSQKDQNREDCYDGGLQGLVVPFAEEIRKTSEIGPVEEIHIEVKNRSVPQRVVER